MMDALAQWSGFQWIGIGVAVLLALAIAAATILVIAALWWHFGPAFHCRALETEMIWSTYRGDVRTGEGERIKCAPDLRIGHLVGVSWRTRWLFGLVLIKREPQK
jgi:hypothetical protein